MRRILALAWLDVTQILRSRGQLVSVIVLPVLLTVVFGFAFGAKSASTVRVAFADRDGSARSKDVGRLLSASPGLAVETTSEAGARKLVSEHDAVAAVVVERGFGESICATATGAKPSLTLLTDPQSQQQAMAVREVVDGIATRFSADALGAQRALAAVTQARDDFGGRPLVILGEGNPSLESLYATADALWEPEPPVKVTAQTVTPSKVRGASTTAEGVTQSSLGFAVMFVLMTAMGASAGILEEREHGTLRRLLATPLTRRGLMGGKILGVLLTAALQAALLIGLGVVFFHVPWGDDPIALLVVLGAYLLAATGLAVFASSLVRTRSQLSAITSIVVVALSMLGGCYWSIDIVSPAMQRVALVTPTGWAMRGLTDVVVRHQGLDAAVLPAAVLLGIAAIAFSLGIWRTRFE